MRIRLKPLIRFPAFLLVGLTIVTSTFIFQQRLLSREGQDFPPLAVHPLPPILQQWQPQNQGDYFSSLESSPVGALVWSEFPVKIYYDRPANLDDTAASQQFQQWVIAVREAIQEWSVYLPLVEVQQRELANVTIERSFPPLGSTYNSETGELEIPRARTAQTRYDFYIKETLPPTLSHRMTVQISPRLSESSVLFATRHELGHAFGIWGHSPVETDVLYFSQVRQPPSISVRDINTLKKVYQQPTRLGWPVVKAE